MWIHFYFVSVTGCERAVCHLRSSSCVPETDWQRRWNMSFCDSPWRDGGPPGCSHRRASHLFCACSPWLLLPVYLQSTLLWVCDVYQISLKAIENVLSACCEEIQWSEDYAHQLIKIGKNHHLILCYIVSNKLLIKLLLKIKHRYQAMRYFFPCFLLVYQNLLSFF